MTRFALEIVTPNRPAFLKEVVSVSVPVPTGVICILAHHTPLFTTLTEGEIKISDEKNEYYLAIGGGFMEVSKNKVMILVSRAIHAHELNEEEIKRAQESAKQIIATKARGRELFQAQAVMRRSILELKVLRRHQKRRSNIAI